MTKSRPSYMNLYRRGYLLQPFVWRYSPVTRRLSLPVPSRAVEQTMVLLLTLSASYPETMARILDELERGLRDTAAFAPSLALCAALQTIIQRWCGREGITEDWATMTKLIQNPGLLDPALTLDDLGLENLQIVRSFSFLGEVEMPIVEKTQRHTVELSSPTTNLTDAS